MLLPKHYYQHDDVVFIARDLLGKILLTEIDGIITSGIIVETEAYRAPEDKASHAFNNRRTERTKTMFLPGGHAYVYLCYGIHDMFNVVTAEDGIAHAVLIRAIEPITGIENMLSRKKMKELKSNITSGPGSVAKAMGIIRKYNECKLYHSKSPIRIYDENIRYTPEQIGISKRIGVDYAEESAEWPYRFFIKGNSYVSGRKIRDRND
jgi:DNA-3-methyladenine glycosylase